MVGTGKSTKNNNSIIGHRHFSELQQTAPSPRSHANVARNIVLAVTAALCSSQAPPPDDGLDRAIEALNQHATSSNADTQAN